MRHEAELKEGDEEHHEGDVSEADVGEERVKTADRHRRDDEESQHRVDGIHLHNNNNNNNKS